MTNIKDIEKNNIQFLINRAIVSDDGKEYSLPLKDIIIDFNPFESFYNSINQFYGKGFRILFLCSKEWYDFTQSLKGAFCSREFFADDFVMQENIVSIKAAERFTANLKDDTRLIIGVGGYKVIETAKLISSSSKLPLVLYITTPECDTAISPYVCAYHNGIKDMFTTVTPQIVCVDMSIMDISQSSLGNGLGVLASKLTALWDWHFSNIFNNESCDYSLAQAALSIIKNFCQNAGNILYGDKSVIFDMIQTQLKLSAICQFAQNPRLMGGGEDSMYNVLEMFFLKENKELRNRGENLILCAKLIFRAYKVWLEKLKIETFFCPPDNTLRLEKLTDYLGLSELVALKKIYMVDNAEQWEIMQYKWNEYKDDLKTKLDEYYVFFQKIEKIFKRIYKDAGFWTTKYLTESDIMLMLGLAPDSSSKFTMLSFVKMTGILDKYLEGV